MAEHAHDYDSYTVAGHPRPQPTYDYAANDADEPRSPLTGRDPNFLDALLPPYVPASPRASPEPLAYQSFYAAYRPGASPSPPPTFLDTILNPAGLDHNRFSPFSYRPSPPAHRQQSALDMPPNTRARAEPPLRPARLPNGYVDLTATPDSPPQRRKRQSPTPGPSAKRQKREDGAADKCEGSEALRVEEVDLTDDNITVKDVLQKQREDAVQAQKKPEEKPTTFNSFNCVICMDMPTDLTATACGHLFCHTCLMEALIAGENRSGPGEPKRSQCPVCRKFINRSKASDIIPLLLKKGLATQPRKKTAPSPSAAAPKV